MATTLVYHEPGATGEVSPFDAAITRLAEGNSVDIACPYLNVGYLRTVTSKAQDWRVLTDLNTW
jgi:hypothetical protein